MLPVHLKYYSQSFDTQSLTVLNLVRLDHKTSDCTIPHAEEKRQQGLGLILQILRGVKNVTAHMGNGTSASLTKGCTYI